MKTEAFIRASESRWFILLFDFYVRSLFFRRFKRVWISQEYQPDSSSRTIYFLNHTSWWDGLIPLLLNQKQFRQKARAMMEDKQMKRHRFFRRIGAFSVNLEKKKALVASLRYAVDSLREPGRSLFIFPEGKIVPFSTALPEFEKGLSWIVRNCPEADVVPIGVYISHKNSDKPECYLKVGKKVMLKHLESSESLHQKLQEEMMLLLIKLQDEAHVDEHPYRRLM